MVGYAAGEVGIDDKFDVWRKMKKSIDEVIEKINEALAESGEPPVEVDDDTIQGVQRDQLPPYVAEMEENLFEEMMVNFERLNGSKPSTEIVECIRFLAKAESIRLHTYRKLAMARLDEFLEDDSDRIFSVS